MIRNVRVEMDGFNYNIVQMSGEQAFKMQLKIVNIISGFRLDVLSDKSEMEALLILVKGLFGAVNPDIVMPIVKELLTTVGFVEVNKAIAESNGYNADRHSANKVFLDHFVGKDLVHLYKLLFEILKANYSDFLIQAKEWLGSSLSGKLTESLDQKPA